MVVTNTLFKLAPRRIYKWRSPQDIDGKVVRNQINFIMIKKIHRNKIKSSITYPGAEINSDHNQVAATLRISLKHVKTEQTDLIWPN